MKDGLKQAIDYDLVIVGFGDLGQRVGEHLKTSLNILAVRRSKFEWAGGDNLALDIAQTNDLPQPATCRTLLYCVSADGPSPEQYQRAYYQGLKNAMACFQPKHTVFISSTRVYGQQTDQTLDENTAPEPADACAQFLLDAEQLVKGKGCSIRLSGIYGPNRLWLVKKAQAGAYSDHHHWTNRIHIEDAARLCATLIQQIENNTPLPEAVIGTDPHPSQMSEVLNWLRQQLKTEKNPEAGMPARTQGKKLKSSYLQDIGFEFQFPDFKAGYRKVLETIRPSVKSAEGTKEKVMSETTRQTVDASVSPKGTLEVLTQREVQKLKAKGESGLYSLFRQCALAILNTGSDSDNAKTILEAYPDFDIEIVQQDRGIRLNLKNAPGDAFVDGEMIASTREMLFSSLRDIVYAESELESKRVDFDSSEGITDYVFHLLRNAKAMRPGDKPNMVVCWGGHSIGHVEYKYTKVVGHELGYRGADICTGCGPGAMKGPMKGATISHAKQRIKSARYLGLTEPGIIAAEAPNPIVNELVILPDIEKRLEAFVRVGHGMIIFPGGAGTAEELLYLLGILLHPENQEVPFPLILTGPSECEEYFKQLHDFIGDTLGYEAQQKYKIIVGNAAHVAREMMMGIEEVKTYRRETNDAYHFNWRLHIDDQFQHPFDPTHDNMAALNLTREQPVHELAANLRRAFSGIVAGNVKSQGIQRIEEFGPYQITGDKQIMEPLDRLLQSFVEQHRMKLPGTKYIPCYEVVKEPAK